ncbi:MAG: universal stress protein [Nitrospirae bacterium]|nr:MAG: universal stress protein [Nitrospirota bacterium]
MKKVLIAVDDTKGSKAVLAAFQNLVQRPEEVILLHVERLLGRSLMINTLGEADLAILREELKDTEYKKELDRKAEKILNYYKKEIEGVGLFSIKNLIKDGIPSEEILKTAEEEKVELILLGCSRKEGLNRLITGSVAQDVEKNAKVPVLTAKRPVLCEEAYTWRDAYYAVSLSTVIILAMFFLGIVFEKVFLP